MPKTKSQSNYTYAYVVGVALAFVVIGFVAVWAYLHPSRYGIMQSDVAYATIGPIHIENQGYTFRASLAVQTSPGDARWALNNRKELDRILHRALMNTDPKILRTPNGLVSVQDALKKTANAAFPEHHVQGVLFTDFVIQAD